MKTIRPHGVRGKKSGFRVLVATDEDKVAAIGELMTLDLTDPLSLAKFRLNHLWAEFGDDWTEDPATRGRLVTAQAFIRLIATALESEREDLWRALSAGLAVASDPNAHTTMARRGNVVAIVERGLAEYHAGSTPANRTERSAKWKDLATPIASLVKSPKTARRLAIFSTISSAALWEPAFEKLSDRVDVVEKLFRRAGTTTVRWIGPAYVAAALSLEVKAFGDETLPQKRGAAKQMAEPPAQACRRLAKTFQTARDALEPKLTGEAPSLAGEPHGPK